MLTIEQNDRLTKVGPGTPAGELMRRYWHPIAASLELDERPTKEVRLLGEDLVLFKDLKGRYGLIDRYCAHRRTDLSYGIPEEDGLRCMYHGWMYDSAGQCVAQPFEDTIHPPQGRTGSASERGAAPARRAAPSSTGRHTWTSSSDRRRCTACPRCSSGAAPAAGRRWT